MNFHISPRITAFTVYIGILIRKKADSSMIFTRNRIYIKTAYNDGCLYYSFSRMVKVRFFLKLPFTLSQFLVFNQN